MKIKFNQDVQFEVIVGDNGEPILEDRFFKKDEVVDLHVVQRNFEFKTVNVEFDNGAVIHGVPESSFDLIEDDDACDAFELEERKKYIESTIDTAECCSGNCGCSDMSESETEIG